MDQSEPVHSERRESSRRYGDIRAPSRFQRIARLIGHVGLGIILIIGIWKWRYVVNEPLWLLRSRYADKSDLYAGKRNNISNLELVQQARTYVSDLVRLDASGNFTAPESLRAQNVHLSAKWFERHHPDAVEFNPFIPAGKGSYVVTWRYFPGCQQTIKSSLKTESDWFDRQGQPCSAVCLVTVMMDPALNLTKINLTPTLN